MILTRLKSKPRIIQLGSARGPLMAAGSKGHLGWQGRGGGELGGEGVVAKANTKGHNNPGPQEKLHSALAYVSQLNCFQVKIL